MALHPSDSPPRSTVNDYFCLWSYIKISEKIHDALYVKCREQAEREASPHSLHHRQPKREEWEAGSASIRMGSMRAN